MSTSAHAREKSGGSVRSSLRKYKEAAPAPISVPTTMPEAGPSTQRKVRTVPPSAAFVPSTPPSPARASNDSTLVDPLALPESAAARKPVTARRPRPKLRYSTSESSWDDVDDEESDDEPPWWTFTNRGMNKMKLRTLRHQEAAAAGGGPTDESGREGKVRPNRKSNKRFSGTRGDGPAKRSSTGPERQESKDRDKEDKPKKRSGGASHDPTPKSSVKNMRMSESPKPMRPPLALPPNMRMSTPAFLRSRKDTSTPPLRIKMKRRYSAPSSPVPDEPIASIGMVTSPVEDGPAQPVPLHASLPIPRAATGHSFLPIPRPPFMKRHSESLTDTEAVASQSVRLKAKRAQSSVRTQNTPGPLETGTGTGTGTSTPMRRGYVRKQTMSKLKLNLPENVTQHFSHGWPHAGSWQDALYGYYDEVPKDKDNSSRRSSKDAKARSGSMPATQPPLMIITTPRVEHGSDSASTPATPPVRRGKSKRRKYRQAIAPPTPSGLGFTAAEKGYGRHDESWKQGRVVEEGFDWGNGHGDGHGHDRITEEGDLSINRTDTRQTTSEKVGAMKQRAAEKVIRKVRPNDGLDWKQRLRRKLFLDARVTIWIRFVNLVVALCSLGLAVVIRNELFALGLPGLMGPSTTLVIAYSCLTVIHIFIAVYREYFGRPIGLWGLRSKMLWVCLDLLFVALWSSALTLQINDLIDTPLECVSQSAWWEEGQSAQYATLLNDLDVLRASGADLRDVGVSETLGIILPDVITNSDLARAACRRQEGGIALALMTLLLYGGNMVLSLFRIFETVRRTAHVDRAVMY